MAIAHTRRLCARHHRRKCPGLGLASEQVPSRNSGTWIGEYRAPHIRAAVEARSRSPLPILVFLTASLLFREIHLDYTGDAIYVCLVITLIWVIRWRERISPQLQEGPVFPWLIATLFTYSISQAIARRFFRIIPGEELLHVPLEEATETAGHIMLIVTSCAGAWTPWQTKPDEKQS